MSEPRRPSAEDILIDLGARPALADHNAEHETSAEPPPWEPPVPLVGRHALPGFPVDALPGWVGDMVAAVAEFNQVPADLPACVALAALSTAAGGRAVVEVRGSWREPVNLFTVVAMPPGARKSPVFAAMTGPIMAAEVELIDRTRPQIVEARLARQAAERAAEKAATVAANADTGRRPDALAEATAAAMQAEAITVPTLPRLVADDVTPETAASLLAEQGGRLAVLSAEGGIFSLMAGRYSGGQPSLEVFLKGHAGDMLRVDRKSRPAEHVDKPALTLGLCVQPEVLRVIADLPGFRGRGLLARILYALPENIVGRRKIGPPSVPEAVDATYTSNLQALVYSLASWKDPAALPLTAEANQAVLDLERGIEPRLAPGADLSGIVDWASKYVGAVVRIAGLLHLATHLCEGSRRPIDAETVGCAARIGEYHLHHALAVFDDVMATDPVVDDARAVLNWIVRTTPSRFTRRDLMAGTSRSRFKKVGDLDPALGLLEQHGQIRRAPEPEHTGPGRRPSPAYEVHPDLATQTTETTKR